MDPRYNIYPTLLDAFTAWELSGEIWERYWGWVDNPPHTPEEFAGMQLRSLIDKINRLPQPFSEAAERGTAFNALIDYFVDGRSDGLESVALDGAMAVATYNGRQYRYPLDIVLRLGQDTLANSLTQHLTEGVLHTPYGPARLYGYIDYVTPTRVVDLKTTGVYYLGKYKRSWQRFVYPYCMEREGSNADGVEFLVVELGKTRKDGTVPAAVYSEYYNWRKDEDTDTLRRGVSRFIEFLEANRDKITDKKIFNEDENTH